MEPALTADQIKVVADVLPFPQAAFQLAATFRFWTSQPFHR